MKIERYIKPLNEVKQVIETKSIEEVNQKIRDGWMLLHVLKPSNNSLDITFSLGKS